MEGGDLDGAAGAFERLLARDPGNPVAAVGLAQVNLFRRVNSYDQAQARRDAAAHPGDVDAQIRVADIEMSLGNAEEAFDRLLGGIRRTSGEDRDKARLHLGSLFARFPRPGAGGSQGPAPPGPAFFLSKGGAGPRVLGSGGSVSASCSRAGSAAASAARWSAESVASRSASNSVLCSRMSSSAAWPAG